MIGKKLRIKNINISNFGGIKIKTRWEVIGLYIVVISLIVSILIVYITLSLNKSLAEKSSQREAEKIARFVSNFSYDVFSHGDLLKKVIRASSDIENVEYFAYLLIRDSDGDVTGKLEARGCETPPPFEGWEAPISWNSSRITYDKLSNRKIYEYNSPLFDNGKFQGSVFVGFFKPRLLPKKLYIDNYAVMVLPILIFGGTLFIILKRETAPVLNLNNDLEMVITNKLENRELSTSSYGLLNDLVCQINKIIKSELKKIVVLEEEISITAIDSAFSKYKYQKINLLIESIPIGIVLISESGVVDFANRKSAILLGIPFDQLLGSSFCKWNVHEDLKSFLLKCQKMNGGFSSSEKLDYRSGNLPDHVISVQAYSVYPKSEKDMFKGLMVVCQDRTEDVLRQKAQEDFVSQISHEFKTPLNALKMYSETLLDRKVEEDFKVEALNAIYDQVGRLDLLINGLLSLTRIEMGDITLNRQRIKMSSFLKDTFETTSKTRSGEHLTFKLVLPDKMSAIFLDKELFRLALNNLLTNAIKYSRPGGTIILSATENEQTVSIHVKDTGIGIDEQDLHRIFDKLYRSGRVEVQEILGHGLGLTLAKEVVTLHDGRLEVRSQLGVGSEFSIILNKNDN